MSVRVLLFAGFVLLGCEANDHASDAGEMMDASVDAGADGSSDAAAELDAGPSDAGPPDAGPGCVCGSACPSLCAVGGACTSAADCETAFCSGGATCQACTMHTDCESGEYCDTGASTGGTCTAVKSLGADCSGAMAGFECESGHCVDDDDSGGSTGFICCDATCGGGCDVCHGDNGASATGNCTVLSALSLGVGCGEYYCDGTADCPTSCSMPSECSNSLCHDSNCCASDCSGACRECSSGSCLVVTSADDADTCAGSTGGCGAGDCTCDAGGLCKRDLGQPATMTSECASGFVVDGVCCDESSCDTCESCAVSGMEGTCQPVVSADDSGTCDGTTDPMANCGASACTCDAGGLCKRDDGQPATMASECASGVVEDNTCCASACDTCETCAAASAEGTCQPVLSADDPLTCDGVETSNCAGDDCTCSATGVCLIDDGSTGSSPSECVHGFMYGTTCANPDYSLATGELYTCAITANGSLRCWGNDTRARGISMISGQQIGDNEAPHTAGDVVLAGSPTVIQVAAGTRGDHTCVLLSTGAMRCFGENGGGQLGYGGTSSVESNVATDLALGSTVTQITAGDAHTCALLATGNVKCWGQGTDGRLGYDSTANVTDASMAANVNVGGTVVQISAGTEHTCAVLDTGAVRCWGRGTQGRLGYGNTSNVGDGIGVSMPPADVSLGAPAVQVAAANSHTCALLNTGEARCWGQDAQGQLGDGNASTAAHIGDNEVPSSVPVIDFGMGAAPAMFVASGYQRGCAVLTDGALHCFGNAHVGQLGLFSTDDIGDDDDPTFPTMVGAPVVRVALGYQHTCVRLATGEVQCWGSYTLGRLGTQSTEHIGDNNGTTMDYDITLLQTSVPYETP